MKSISELNNRAYDDNAIKFQEKFIDYDDYNRMITEFSKYIIDGDRVLDLGCGPGNVSKKICELKSSLKITGVDLADEMIRLARKNVKEGTFITEDIRNVNFDKESFNVVFLSFCIVHLDKESVIKLIEKVFNILKIGGVLYISFMGGKKDGFEETSFSKDKIYFYYYEDFEVLKILEDRGFKILEFKNQGYPEKDGTFTKDTFIFAKKERN